MTALDRPYWIEARFERGERWDDDVYPFNLPVVRRTDVLPFHPRVTFVVGRDNKIVKVFPDVDPAIHADEVLAAAPK